MENLSFDFGTTKLVSGHAHVGIVGSGDLEILIEKSTDDQRAYVEVCTSVAGHMEIWKAVLDHFFNMHPYSIHIEINDFGATPGVVLLRLAQAMEVLQDAK
ncbi:MAG: malonate decarboxylase subunit delta [Paenibacillaceae bacterium]